MMENVFSGVMPTIKPKGKKMTVGQVVILAALILLLFLTIVPIWLMLIKSVKSIDQGNHNPYTLTFPFSWDNYKLAWLNVSPYILNTIVISLFTTFFSIFLCSLMAFGFTCFKFPGKNALFLCVLALTMIPSSLTLLPQYELVNKFGLLDYYPSLFNPEKVSPTGPMAAVVLPLTAGQIPLGVMLLKTFYNGLPGDLFEAAELDGASQLFRFFKIAVPLSLPITATLGLTAWMASWNDLIWSTLVLRYDEVQTFTVALGSFTSDYYEKTHSWGVPLAAYVICSLPLILIFAFTSKQFVSGLTSGAFKM